MADLKNAFEKGDWVSKVGITSIHSPLQNGQIVPGFDTAITYLIKANTPEISLHDLVTSGEQHGHFRHYIDNTRQITFRGCYAAHIGQDRNSETESSPDGNVVFSNEEIMLAAETLELDVSSLAPVIVGAVLGYVQNGGFWIGANNDLHREVHNVLVSLRFRDLNID